MASRTLPDAMEICVARGAPQNFEVSYNISATSGASDFKFGAQLEFAKVHHKITSIEKMGIALG